MSKKICSECGKEKDVWEFYDKYARCKQCTREDQNAANWYKSVAVLPYEQWPGALQAYVEMRREYLSQGRSVPAIAKDMVLAYQLSLGDDPEEPQAVSLPVVVALHRQVKHLAAEVQELREELAQQRQAKPMVDHHQRTVVGELTNLFKDLCAEIDGWVSADRVDPMDAADIKEGVRLLNSAVEHSTPLPAKGILNCVLTLAQLSLSAPVPLEELYLKYYKPMLHSAAAPDRARVQEIAGVDLYEYDWIQFLNED